MTLKKLLLGAVAGALFASSAVAQVNFVPQVGVTSGYGAKATYSSAFFGLVPPASATDVVCIAASASKTIRVQRLVIGGTGTAVSLPIQVLRRAALDTGGTIGLTTANPGIVTQISSRDTNASPNLSASAALVSYTAVPTINDAAPVYVDSGLLGVVATTVGTPTPQTVFDWGRDTENLIQTPTLAKGSTQQLCVNFGGVSTTSSLNGQITWTEE
jgi:hypothetical protein